MSKIQKQNKGTASGYQQTYSQNSVVGQPMPSTLQAHTNPCTNRATLPFHISNLNSSTSHRSLMQDSMHILNSKQMNQDLIAVGAGSVSQVNGGSKRQSLLREADSKKNKKTLKVDKRANKENIYTGNVSRERSPMAHHQADPKGKLTHRTSTDNRQPNSSKKLLSNTGQTKKSKNSRKDQVLQQQDQNIQQNFSSSVMQVNLKNEQKKLFKKFKQSSKSKNFAHLSNVFMSSTLTHKNNANGHQSSTASNSINTHNLANLSQLNMNTISQLGGISLKLTTNSNQALNSTTNLPIPFYLMASIQNHRSPQHSKSSGIQSNFGVFSKQSPQTQQKQTSHTHFDYSHYNQNHSNYGLSQNNHIQNHLAMNQSQMVFNTGLANMSNVQNCYSSNGRKSQGPTSRSNHQGQTINKSGTRKSTVRGASYGLIGKNTSENKARGFGVFGPSSRNGSPSESICRDQRNQLSKLQSQMKRVTLSSTRSDQYNHETLQKQLSTQQSRKKLTLAPHYEGSPPLARKPTRKQSASKKIDSQSSTLRTRSSAGKIQKYSGTVESQQTKATCRNKPDFISTNNSLLSQNNKHSQALQASCLSIIKEKSRQNNGGSMFKSSTGQNNQNEDLSNSKRVSTERSINFNRKPPLSNFSSSPKLQKSKVPPASQRPSQGKMSSHIQSESNSVNRKSSSGKARKECNQKAFKQQTENLINFYGQKPKNLKNLISKVYLNRLIKELKNESMPKMIQDFERTMSREKDSRRLKQGQQYKSIQDHELNQLFLGNSPGPQFNNQQMLRELNSDLQFQFSQQDTNSVESCVDGAQPYSQQPNDDIMFKTFKNRDNLLEAAIFGEIRNQQKHPNSLRNSINIQLQENLRKLSQENSSIKNSLCNKNINPKQVHLRQNSNKQMSLLSEVDQQMQPVFSVNQEQSKFGTNTSVNSKNLNIERYPIFSKKLSEDNTTSATKQQQKQQKTVRRSSALTFDQNCTASINQRIFSIEEVCTTPKMRTMHLQPTPSSEFNETPLNNTQIGQEELQQIVEAKLHLHQFNKVFCKDQLKQKQFAQQMNESQSFINGEEDQDISGITDFSLEFEMLNKLHVQKNTLDDMKNLPILNDHLVPDLSCSLYQEQYDNGKIVKFTKDNRNKIQFKDPFKGKPKLKIDKQRLQQTFQMLQEVSGSGFGNQLYDETNIYQGDDGVPKIVNMSDSSQIIANDTYRHSLEQTPFNPFSTVLRCKQNQNMLFEGKKANNNDILFIGPSSGKPSSCHTSPSSKSSETNYQVQKILGRDSFDELESIIDDSKIYFGNAPVKKGNHHRFQSRNSDVSSLNNRNEAGFGMFSRDYDKNSYQAVIQEEEKQGGANSRQHLFVCNLQKQSSFGFVNRQLFNSSIHTPTAPSVYFDSFIIPEDPKQLQDTLNLKLEQDFQRISAFREIPFPIFNGMPQMSMKVYNAMKWFDQKQSLNHNQPQIELEFFDFDQQPTSFDKTISPSSFESRNFPSPTCQVMMIDTTELVNQHHIAYNCNSTSKKDINKRLSYPYSNQSSNNKYKRRQQPQQHPESRNQNYYINSNRGGAQQQNICVGSGQKRSSIIGNMIMQEEEDEIVVNQHFYDADDFESGNNLLSESYSL
eukprot:403357264